MDADVGSKSLGQAQQPIAKKPLPKGLAATSEDMGTCGRQEMGRTAIDLSVV